MFRPARTSVCTREATQRAGEDLKVLQRRRDQGGEGRGC